MLTCREVAERASDYLDHETSLSSRVEIRLHLALCRPCRLCVRQLASTIELVRRAEVRPPDPGTGQRLLDAFRCGQSARNDSLRSQSEIS